MIPEENMTLCQPGGCQCMASVLEPSGFLVLDWLTGVWLKMVSQGYSRDWVPLCSWFSCFPRWHMRGGYSIRICHLPVPFRE